MRAKVKITDIMEKKTCGSRWTRTHVTRICVDVDSRPLSLLLPLKLTTKKKKGEFFISFLQSRRNYFL